jgi:hypothetical protein
MLIVLEIEESFETDWSRADEPHSRPAWGASIISKSKRTDEDAVSYGRVLAPLVEHIEIAFAIVIVR